VNVKLKILFAVTALLVGGLWLFTSGTDQGDTVKNDVQGLARMPNNTFTPAKTIPTPFSEPSNHSTSQAVDSQSRQKSITPMVDKPVMTVSDNENEDNQSPLQVIEDYMTAWSGSDRAEVNALWRQIGQCPECLQRIKDLLMNQGVPKGMLLELTYKIIELGDQSMLPVFDYLLQPSVDVNTRIIITQQMIQDGRDMYVKKLFDILQQADMDGYQDYAAKHVWMISKLKNPQGTTAIFDVMSGRSGSSERFAAHVRNVFNNTLLGIKREGMTDTMVEYYQSANATEQANLWAVISLHSESLVALSKDAYENGDLSQFKHYSQALVDINSVGAVEGVLNLASEVDYSQEYFSDIISAIAQRFNNLETLHKLEDYLRNPNAHKRTRMVAAEGLLAVKDSGQARYILEKALNSNSYEDAEIVAYISARL